MKTLNIDLDKLSRKGLKAYLTLLEEWDDYKMNDGVALPLEIPEDMPDELEPLEPIEEISDEELEIEPPSEKLQEAIDKGVEMPDAPEYQPEEPDSFKA